MQTRSHEFFEEEQEVDLLKMEILTDEYLTVYRKKYGKKLNSYFKEFDKGSDSNNFDYYLESSAVYSSNIEGNTIDLNSFMNSKFLRIKKSNKEHKEIVDLIEAYKFAERYTLNEKNFLKAHGILSKHILIRSKQGIYREEKIGVFDAGGLVYLAVEPEYVKSEIKKLFNDIKYLKQSESSLEEIFYYASMIHLILAHIHPFMDGNGRAARLAEKWFLSVKLGKIMWEIKSEKYYFENRSKYYRNINMGSDYYELNYNKCFPFLEMLIKSLKNNKH